VEKIARNERRGVREVDGERNRWRMATDVDVIEIEILV